MKGDARDCPRTHRVTFAAASPADRRTGLLGWVSFTIDPGIRVDGVAVRLTRGARFALSWPERRDRHGIHHAVARPVDGKTGREIEHQLLAPLIPLLRSLANDRAP